MLRRRRFREVDSKAGTVMKDWVMAFLISIRSVFGKWRDGSNYTNENEGKCDASHGDSL
jgi:hypothetical protein